MDTALIYGSRERARKLLSSVLFPRGAAEQLLLGSELRFKEKQFQSGVCGVTAAGLGGGGQESNGRAASWAWCCSDRCYLTA